MNSLMTFLSVFLAVVAVVGYVACLPVEETGNKVLTISEKDTSVPNDLIKRNWSGMKGAWGKRADEDEEDEDFEIPQRQIRGPNSWQSGLGAWGKRAGGGGWGQNLRAWGKRTPAEWNSDYLQSMQRQMEAVKNRRASNWQLASWGRR